MRLGSSTDPNSARHCSSHLADLKSLTHDVLYETYRTEKLSRTVHSDTQCVYHFHIVYCALTDCIAVTLPSFLKSSLPRASVLKKSNSAERKKSSVRSNSRYSARSTRRDRSCWRK